MDAIINYSARHLRGRDRKGITCSTLFTFLGAFKKLENSGTPWTAYNLSTFSFVYFQKHWFSTILRETLQYYFEQCRFDYGLMPSLFGIFLMEKAVLGHEQPNLHFLARHQWRDGYGKKRASAAAGSDRDFPRTRRCPDQSFLDGVRRLHLRRSAAYRTPGRDPLFDGLLRFRCCHVELLRHPPWAADLGACGGWNRI